MPQVRTQSDDPPRALWRVHGMLWISGLQVREAELHRDEVPAVQRRGTGREEGAQGQYVLWVLELSEVQVHLGQQANPGEVPDVRPRIPCRKEPESGSRDRLPQ